MIMMMTTTTIEHSYTLHMGRNLSVTTKERKIFNLRKFDCSTLYSRQLRLDEFKMCLLMIMPFVSLSIWIALELIVFYPYFLCVPKCGSICSFRRASSRIKDYTTIEERKYYQHMHMVVNV